MAPSEMISPHYAVLNYRGKRMFRDHQTQIKKIVYFPAEFFLGMTVKRKLFFSSFGASGYSAQF